VQLGTKLEHSNGGCAGSGALLSKHSTSMRKGKVYELVDYSYWKSYGQLDRFPVIAKQLSSIIRLALRGLPLITHSTLDLKNTAYDFLNLDFMCNLRDNISAI
jgi:hypothetical protein